MSRLGGNTAAQGAPPPASASPDEEEDSTDEEDEEEAHRTPALVPLTAAVPLTPEQALLQQLRLGMPHLSAMSDEHIMQYVTAVNLHTHHLHATPQAHAAMAALTTQPRPTMPIEQEKKRGKWTTEQDAMLRQTVELHHGRNWKVSHHAHHTRTSSSSSSSQHGLT